MHCVSDKHKEELNQWYKDIKKQLTSKAHENFFKRLQEVVSIVNTKLEPLDTKLHINNTERRKMWNGIANDIDSWKGVEITACTKQKTDYKSYAITSRNWWNRNKAKVYGNHFFYPIIFVYIKQSVDGLHMTSQEKQYHFVDIFDEILHAKIQFPQTRAQPIIPHQSFIQPNKFKYSSIDLLKTHGIHWNGKNIDSNPEDETSSTNSASSHSNTNNGPRQSYYVKDKDRSLKVNNSFMDSLELLKQRLHRTLVIDDNGHLKIKTELKDAAWCNLKKENANGIGRNQCLPPSIRMKADMSGINCTNIAARSLMINPHLNNNHNPMAVSHGTRFDMMAGNAPDMNGINTANSVNTNFTFTPPVIQNHSHHNNNDIASLLSSLATHGSAHVSSPSMNDALFNGLMLSNLNPNYGPSRGQANLVSHQRYSPSAVPLSLPVNLPNVNNSSYCSIRSDPMSGQLMLSLHIPLN